MCAHALVHGYIIRITYHNIILAHYILLFILLWQEMRGKMLMWQEKNYAFDKRNPWMTVGNLNITL